MMNPKNKVILIIGAMLVVLFSFNPIILASYYILCVLPSFGFVGFKKVVLKWLVLIILSIGLPLLIIYGFILESTPGELISGHQKEGIEYSFRILFRLLIIVSTIQIVSEYGDPTKTGKLMYYLKIPINLIFLVISSMITNIEMVFRMNQIITSAKSRAGEIYVHPIQRWVRTPIFIMPLFSWFLRSSITRGELWYKRNVPKLLLRRLSQVDIFNEGHQLIISIYIVGITLSHFILIWYGF